MQIIEAPPGSMAIMAFGAPTQAAINYVQQDMARAATVFNDLGRQGMGMMQAMFDSFGSEAALRKARELTLKASWLFQSDVVRPLFTAEELRAAQSQMQRYLMADPELRRSYHRHECDGYSATYIDRAPNDVGIWHQEYRDVTNGYVNMEVMTTPEDDPTETVEWCTIHFDEPTELNPELNIDQQQDIQLSWAAQRLLRKAGYDTTSIHGDML